MTRDELSASMLERETLMKFTGAEADNAKKTYEALVKSSTPEKAALAFKEKSLDVLMKQQSVQERLTASMEKLKMSLAPIAELVLAILEPIIKVAGFVANIVNGFMNIGGVIQQLMGPLGTLGKIIEGFVGALFLAAAATLAILAFATGGFGIPSALAAVAVGSAGLSLLKHSTQTVEDGQADSSRGPFNITDKFGATAVTTPGDHVVVSPNVNKSNSINSSMDMNPLINEVKALRSEMKGILTQILHIRFMEQQ